MVGNSQVPMWLMKKYQKAPEILKGFLTNVWDLIQFLKSERYIREDTAAKWEEKIRQASAYLENYDLMAALKEVFVVAKEMQLILDRIKTNAFRKDQKIPEPLKKRLESLAESSREFLVTLLDTIDYYTDANNSPPIVQASWSEKVNNAYFLLEQGEIWPAIGNVLSVMENLRPLLNEIRNQITSSQPSYTLLL